MNHIGLGNCGQTGLALDELSSVRKSAFVPMNSSSRESASITDLF